MRRNLETTFNNLVHIKEVIGKDTKDGEDYVGTVLEGIQIKNNGTKKVVNLVL